MKIVINLFILVDLIILSHKDGEVSQRFESASVIDAVIEKINVEEEAENKK